MSAGILVLCYHAIADLAGDPVLSEYGIEPAVFAAQLDRLVARGFTFVGPDDLLALLEGKRVPDKAVLLTFDDCYEELRDVARTILRPRGIKAIAFAVSAIPSGTNEWDQAIGARRMKLLDAAGLKEASRLGIEIGCHSRSHRPLVTVPVSELADEMIGSADDIEAFGVPRPRFFAYPHGQHDADSRSAARNAGFLAAFGLSPATATSRSDRFAIPRVEILASDLPWRFLAKTVWPPLSTLFQPTPIAARIRGKIARGLRKLAVLPASR